MSDAAAIDESGVSAPFWEAASESRLVIQRCDACERYVWYPRALCPHCGSMALTWTPVAGAGTIYSLSVHHRPARPELADKTPYVIVLVDLDEGVRMMARMADGTVADEVSIGRRVRWAPDPTGGKAFVFELT